MMLPYHQHRYCGWWRRICSLLLLVGLIDPSTAFPSLMTRIRPSSSRAAVVVVSNRNHRGAPSTSENPHQQPVLCSHSLWSDCGLKRNTNDDDGDAKSPSLFPWSRNTSDPDRSRLGNLRRHFLRRVVLVPKLLQQVILSVRLLSLFRTTNVTQRMTKAWRRRAAVIGLAWALTMAPWAGGSASAAGTAGAAAVKSSSSLPPVEAIVRKYVHEHMFDDAAVDTVADTYLERMQDATVGSHPDQLRQAIAQASGEGDLTTVVLEASPSKRGSGRIDIGALALTAVQTLQTKLGVSRGFSMVVLAAASVVTPIMMFLLIGSVAGGYSKRTMAKVFQTRYGENYTVDATLKPDDIDDDDVTMLDDEDDDEEADDDDDDADDDDSDKGKRK